MLDFVVFVVARQREEVAIGRDSAKEMSISESDNPCEKGESSDNQEAAVLHLEEEEEEQVWLFFMLSLDTF